MAICNKPLIRDEENLKKFFGSDFYTRPWEDYIVEGRGFYTKVRARLSKEWQYDLSCMFDGERDTVYSDPRHYNDHGQQLIAERVFEIVLDTYFRAEETR